MLVGFPTRLADALMAVVDLVSVLILAKVARSLVVGDVSLGSVAVNDASDLLGWEVGREEVEAPG